MQPSHVYVITRRDIPSPHLHVQVGHAAFAAALAFGNPKHTHPNLVLCAVDTEQELTDAFERLKAQGVPVLSWREDDMGNALTAIATAPLTGPARKPLRRFRLLA